MGTAQWDPSETQEETQVAIENETLIFLKVKKKIVQRLCTMLGRPLLG